MYLVFSFIWLAVGRSGWKSVWSALHGRECDCILLFWPQYGSSLSNYSSNYCRIHPWIWMRDTLMCSLSFRLFSCTFIIFNKYLFSNLFFCDGFSLFFYSITPTPVIYEQDDLMQTNLQTFINQSPSYSNTLCMVLLLVLSLSSGTHSSFSIDLYYWFLCCSFADDWRTQDTSYLSSCFLCYSSIANEESLQPKEQLDRYYKNNFNVLIYFDHLSI